MAAESSSREPGKEQAESMIDDLIREILHEPGHHAGSAGSGTAALLERALGGTRSTSRTALLEKILITEAFASELAEALAPALAEQLAPRLLKALEQLMASEAAPRKPGPAGRPASGRKPEAR